MSRFWTNLWNVLIQDEILELWLKSEESHQYGSQGVDQRVVEGQGEGGGQDAGERQVVVGDVDALHVAVPLVHGLLQEHVGHALRHLDAGQLPPGECSTVPFRISICVSAF